MKREKFEELKRQSVGHSLVKAGRIYSEHVFSCIKKALGAKNFRPSHFNLIAHIPFEGITIVDLAKKANISKQATSVMVKSMLDEKILIKIENAKDKRSFLVTFDQSKKSKVFNGMKVAASLDEEFTKFLSESEVKGLGKILDKIIHYYSDSK